MIYLDLYSFIFIYIMKKLQKSSNTYCFLIWFASWQICFLPRRGWGWGGGWGDNLRPFKNDFRTPYAPQICFPRRRTTRGARAGRRRRPCWLQASRRHKFKHNTKLIQTINSHSARPANSCTFWGLFHSQGR